MNPGIGSIALGNGIMEHRASNRGRVIVREIKDDIVEILGKSGKKKKNQKCVIDRVRKNLEEGLYGPK
jgi:hypothetical protein